MFVLRPAEKRWHPDKWALNPATAGEAKRRFQQIQEAYSGYLANCIITLISIVLIAAKFD